MGADVTSKTLIPLELLTHADKLFDIDLIISKDMTPTSHNDSRYIRRTLCLKVSNAC